MATSFLDRLKSGDVLVADGAMGTNLQLKGLARGQAPEEWLFDAPDKVLDLHRAFVEAGSDIILTNSFGGTRLRMDATAYADRPAEANRLAAELAREAAGMRDGVFVAGSMGPTGHLFEPLGNLTYDVAVENFAEQGGALAEGGVDLFLVETMFSLDEALAAVEGARRAAELPIVCSISFDRGVHTMSGLTPADAVQTLNTLGLAALGANCGKSPGSMLRVVNAMVEARPGVPIWCKPNAGLPRSGEYPPQYDESPQEMAAHAASYVQAGAQIVGGCCGTTPQHLKAMAQAVREAVGNP